MTAIATAGLVLRLVVIMAFDGRPIADDGFTFLVGAHDLVEGDGFINALDGSQDARNPPGWKVVLAVPILLGIDDPLAIQLYAGLLGVATVVAVGFLGRRIAGPNVGLLAAAIAAVYPGFWTYERELHSETALLLGVAVLLLLAYRFRERPSFGRATALGVAVAMLALVRAETLVLALILVMPLILSTEEPWRPRASGWRRPRPLLSSSSCRGRPTTSIGSRSPSCCRAGSAWPWPRATVTRPTTASTSAPTGSLAFSTRVGSQRLERRQLDASEVDIAAREAALDYAGDNLGRVPVVLAARQARTWGVMAPSQQIRFDSESSNTPEWVGWSAMVGYWVLAPLAVGGAVILRRRGAPIWPLLAVVGSVAIATSLTFGQTRYRASAEVPIILLAATTLAALWSRWRAPSSAGADRSSAIGPSPTSPSPEG